MGKKFAPEPVIFLERVLAGCCEEEEKKGKKEGFVPVGVVGEGLVEFLKGGMGKKGKKGKKGKGGKEGERARECVKLVLGLVRKFSLCYSHFDCYPSLFSGNFFIFIIL